MGSLCFYLSSSLLLFVSILELSVGGESKTHWEDIEGLKKLKGEIAHASITPGSCVSSWDFSVDPCDHIFSERFTCGFRCERVVSGWNRVTEISLDRAGYSGSLSTSTWNFPYLEILDLTDNSFTGSIPSSLSNMVSLRRLVLSRNSFSGSIPNSIGGSLSKLEELYLDYNHLQGPIPLSINNLVSLKRLGIQGNKLNGGFPSLGSLKSLIFLDASDNEISGRIPSNLPPSLVQILMRNNKLEGSLPEKIENLGYLQVIDLSHNILSGSVPSSLFTHPSLQQVTLSHNKFSSLQVPNKNSGSELLALDLSYNELQGNLPPFMAMMPRLSALSLEKNRFTGLIPSQYALKTVSPVMGTSQFVRLLLGGNYLVGSIPRPLMALKPGSAIVSLVDNCLHRCPSSFFFCQGGVQKSSMACKNFARTVAAAAIP